MRCQDVMELLSPYLDGALATEEREAVRLHVARCPKCSAELEELRACIGMLKELPLIAPPTGFRVGLMEKIDQLPSQQGSSKDKNIFDRVTGIARSSWYRVVAVAAVMAMAVGITSLWEKEGVQFLPLEQKPKGVVAVHEPQKASKEPPVVKEQQPSQVGQSSEPGASGSKSAVNSKGSGVKQPDPQQGNATVPVITEAVKKQVEGYVPKPSTGMAVVSASLRLDVVDIEAALKSVGSIALDNGGTYLGSQDSGSIGIKVPRQSFERVIGALQKLGGVLSYLPTEKDVSVQHQTAKAELERLKAEQGELQTKLTSEPSQELERQLADLNQALLKQIDTMKQLEDRTNHCLINITLQ
ncbi:zf-HC2 domain-containing protein [Desulforamulus aeronauticus]|uniref:Anti-sigma-W factor RsiW n=1 Tax=Desulforamulus aeronauticus DSM 10349 TaxID=1121421 RepID=A0A1M6WVN2_9FIRM|nr:zf-HC2 domain-containing protein [Desulforamulus aeronauticus]SHK97840.1 protein of unknown function [Desulforamulus aeronauticus DSM 10349]